MTNGNIISFIDRTPLAGLSRTVTNNIQPSGDDVMLATTIVLNNADIIALPTTPIELVAAVTNKTIVPFAVFIQQSDPFTGYIDLDDAAFLSIYHTDPYGYVVSLLAKFTTDSISSLVNILAGGVSVGAALVGIGALKLKDGYGTTGWNLVDNIGVSLKMKIQDNGQVLGGGDSANTLTVTTFYGLAPQ